MYVIGLFSFYESEMFGASEKLMVEVCLSLTHNLTLPSSTMGHTSGVTLVVAGLPGIPSFIRI